MTPKTEPVVTASMVIGFILSLLAFLIGRGYINWTPEDMSAFGEWLAYAVPLSLVLVSGFAARRFTTSLARPRNADLEDLMSAAQWKALERAERP